MVPFEILDHTADIALKLIGEDIPDLFMAAFSGFIEITGISAAELTGDDFEVDINVSGFDNEELLVRFLNELLRIVQENEILPLNVNSLSIINGSLSCSISARRIQEFPDGYVEIKAATYHMLKIEKENKQFVTTCILDV